MNEMSYLFDLSWYPNEGHDFQVQLTLYHIQVLITLLKALWSLWHNLDLHLHLSLFLSFSPLIECIILWCACLFVRNQLNASWVGNFKSTAELTERWCSKLSGFKSSIAKATCKWLDQRASFKWLLIQAVVNCLIWYQPLATLSPDCCHLTLCVYSCNVHVM